LRFPEFTEEWEEKKLGEIATNKSKKYNPKTDNTIVKCIELEHLGSDTGELLGFIDGSQSGSIKNVFRKGDVLFGKLRPYLKKYHQPNFDGVCSSEIWVLNGKEISNDFLYYLIQTNSFIDLTNQSSGSKMPRADWSVLEKGLFFFPCKKEQERIYGLFQKIEKRILSQKKILSELEKLRIQIKDNLLSQKIRFKNESGNNYYDWKKVQLEEVCEKQSSNISANKIEDNFGEFPIYGATGFFKNVDFYEVETDYIAIIKDGAGVGRLFLCNGKSSVLGTLDIITPKNINLYFLYCLLSNINFDKYSTGSTIPHIYFKDYKNEFCTIPCIEEQTKIVNFLSKISDKIEIEKKILELLEQQKKYFLQNMFI